MCLHDYTPEFLKVVPSRCLGGRSRPLLVVLACKKGGCWFHGEFHEFGVAASVPADGATLSRARVACLGCHEGPRERKVGILAGNPTEATMKARFKQPWCDANNRFNAGATKLGIPRSPTTASNHDDSFLTCFNRP